MIKKRTRPIGNIPTKAKGTPIQSNHSMQKLKQDIVNGPYSNNMKHPIESSSSNMKLIKKIPFKNPMTNINSSIFNKNQKAIENDINKVEMKIDQTTDNSLENDFQFQRETDHMSMLRNFPHDDHINQIININIYNNMNETIQTCSGKNCNTQREDSFIQNISIGDIDIQQVKHVPITNGPILSHTNLQSINIVEEINIIDKDNATKVLGNNNERSKKDSSSNNHNNIGNSLVKELRLKNNSKCVDKQNLIIDNNNNTNVIKGAKKKKIIYLSVGVGLLFVVIIVCLFYYIFKKKS